MRWEDRQVRNRDLPCANHDRSSRHVMLSPYSIIVVDHDAAYSQPGLGYGEYSEGDSEAGYGHASVMPKPGHIQKYNPKQEDPAVTDARARNKAQAKGKLANKTKPDTLGRAAKKYFAKSSKSSCTDRESLDR